MSSLSIQSRKITHTIIAAGILASSGAHAKTITISSGENNTIEGTHPDSTLKITGGHLHIKPDALLGGSSITNPSIAMSGGTLAMDGGARVTGEVSVKGKSEADIGKVGTAPAKTGGIFGQEQSRVRLDNVVVDGIGDGSKTTRIAAIDLHDQSSITTTARTNLVGGSTQDGVTLFDKAKATLNGSKITAGYMGVSVNHQSVATLSDVRIIAAGGGIMLSEGATATVNGGSITTTNTRGVGHGIGALQDFDAFGAEVSGLTESKANPTLTISNTEINVKGGLKNTGLGFVAHNNTHPVMTINNSNVHADGFGAVFDGHGTVFDDPKTFDSGSGVSTLNLNDTSLRADKEEAIWVQSNSGHVYINMNGSKTQLHAGPGKAVLKTDPKSITTVTITDANIVGDAVNNGGTTTIGLEKNASWTGKLQNVSNVNLTSGAALNLTGASSVSNLNNAGTVFVANGHETGNTLTIGNYKGNNGNLVLNTVAGARGSATDKVVVNGDTSGTTNVYVVNRGGTGASVLDGIELIQVNGKSEGEFTQKGRIVAGAYDYHLSRGQNGNSKNWYLNSSLNSDPAPVSYEIEHIIRPEAGSYIANQAATSMFLTTLHDRAGENRYKSVYESNGETSSLWLRQVGNHNRFRDNSGQLKTTSNSYVAQLGGDVAEWSSNNDDRWHLGLMAGYGNSQSNTHSSASGHHSKGTITGYSIGTYVTWYQNDRDRTGAYVDSQFMYSWFNNRVSGDAIDSESYKSKATTLSVETGYTLALGETGSYDNPTRYFLEPQAQITWMGTKVDELKETSGTRIHNQGNDNIQTRLGIRTFILGHNHIDNGKGRNFQLFTELNWLHNSKRYGVTMDGISLEQSGATNIAEMKVGVEGQLSKPVSLWGNIGHQIGGKGYSNSSAMVGIKYSF